MEEVIDGLQVIAKMKLGRSQTIVHIVCDSVVNFTGDAIVNAANEGCLGGGGVDPSVGVGWTQGGGRKGGGPKAGVHLDREALGGGESPLGAPRGTSERAR